MTFRIGIISAQAAQAERRLAGVDHIIRGGDIGRPEIIDALRRIASCYRDPRKRGYRRLDCCIP